MRSASTFSTLTCLVLVAILAGPAQANLLVNGGFEAGGSSPCASGWKSFTTSFPPAICKYDGTVHVPYPAVHEGLHRGSIDLNCAGTGDGHVYQTVTVIPGQPVRLTGWIAGFSGTAGYTFFARIRDGADLSGTIVATLENGDMGWQPVDISGTPTGTQVTVEWGFSGPALNWQYAATHADALVLTQVEPDCTGEPTVVSLSQDFGTSGSTLTGMQVSGTNFDSTCQVIFQASGLPDIQAANESADAGGTTLTFDVPLVGEAMGARNLVITKTNCNGLTLNNAFYVVMPALTNGSFEGPTAPPSCPNPPTPLQGAPSHWLQMGVSTMEGHLMRDSDQYPPSCPRPDGDHYASVLVPIGISFADWSVFQYVAVTPGQPITVSGMFAGGGRTQVELKILDGNENGPTLATRVIERRKGCPAHGYNWLPANVSATPTRGFITLLWNTHAEQNQFASIDIVHVSHADNLVLAAGGPPSEICGNGIDDDGDRQTDCQDADCAAEPACSPPPAEICGNGADDDGDLDIDCDDSDCADVCVEVCNNGLDDDGDCIADDGCTEICDNTVDDNDDGLIDCADPECFASPLCSEICDNGTDDNNNGLVDCYDPLCEIFGACQCNDPAYDSDGDTDVDMDDFAALQRCMAATAVFSQACHCFDGDRDGDVDDQDVVRLIHCASGSNVAADVDCD